MRAAKKLAHPHAGIRFPVFPERFPYPHGRQYLNRDLACAACHCHRDSYSPYRLADLEVPARHGKMVRKERSGR